MPYRPTNQPTDQLTNRPTDQPTDKAGYRVACTRLKIQSKSCDYIININFSQKFMLDRQKSEIVQTIMAERCALFIFYKFQFRERSFTTAIGYHHGKVDAKHYLNVWKSGFEFVLPVRLTFSIFLFLHFLCYVRIQKSIELEESIFNARL